MFDIASLPLVRRAVFMRELAPSVYERNLQVVVGIGDVFTRSSITDLKVHDVFLGFVLEIVGVSRTRAKARAHARGELRSAFVR